MSVVALETLKTLYVRHSIDGDISHQQYLKNEVLGRFNLPLFRSMHPSVDTDIDEDNKINENKK